MENSNIGETMKEKKKKSDTIFTIVMLGLCAIGIFGGVGMFLSALGIAIVLWLIKGLIVDEKVRAIGERYEGYEIDEKAIKKLKREIRISRYPLEESFYKVCNEQGAKDIDVGDPSKKIQKAIEIAKYNEKFATIKPTREAVLEAYKKGRESVVSARQKKRELEQLEFETKIKKSKARFGEEINKKIHLIRSISSDYDILDKYCPVIFHIVKDGNPSKLYVLQTAKGTIAFGKNESEVPDTFSLTYRTIYGTHAEYVAPKTVYTGATVGGVTTGGFQQTEGYYKEKAHAEENKMVIQIYSQSYDIEMIHLCKDIYKKVEYGNNEKLKNLIDFNSGMMNLKNSERYYLQKSDIIEWLTLQL